MLSKYDISFKQNISYEGSMTLSLSKTITKWPPTKTNVSVSLLMDNAKTALTFTLMLQ